MKKFTLAILFLFFISAIKAQSTGDTIVVKSFKYGSTTRDTVINFPSGNLTFEKIILKYNMRCKNALVSTQSAPNQGCGEWDYSCNTFIVDSTKIENALNTAPSHVISNFTGSTFNYVTSPVYDYYNYNQTNVTYSIVSENQYTVGTGFSATPNFLKANEKSFKSQILFTAAELTTAGFTAGNIDGIILNVANTGGNVNFFRVGVQNATVNALSTTSLTTTGFATVYNNNYSFVNGNNRIQFYTPFVWNGTSNLLMEFSFTNTMPSNPIIFNGATTASVMSVYSKNNYALDFSALGRVNLNTSMLSSINNQISVTFWAHGNASQLPANTVLMSGTGSTTAQRNLNLHMPWSDNNIYFDCGYGSGGYDRINKVATAAEQGGQWNHWAFTKNATTGDMKIYLNGSLWFSATAKTKPISILNLILGTDESFSNNYKGKINELTIWDKELALNDIQTCMNKPIDATHPFYSNLKAYYKMNEGTGLTISDSKNPLTATGVNLQWTYDRGNNLKQLFSETNLRPNVVFLKGNYSITTNTVTTKDSLARNPNIVQQYSITSNATVTPMANDLVALTSTSNLYEATPQKVFDGDNGLLTGTIAVVPQGSIGITTLNYYKRYPFYNEILSFVTPYGKGLNLGVKGKTWYYDITDFSPILKGSKRMMMSMGGEYQEQMDIDFIFIVGTPPRNVLEFNQLWQGGARLGGVGIGSIINDSRFSALTVPTLSNGKSFKLRSTITGHGQHGEFHQNGGTINHYFNVNGGSNEFTWQITKECSTIPVYPQGGTWLYDRQGWCPGQTSVLKELNLTPFIAPGSTVTLDYNCSNPPVSTGDYRYIVAKQLITYGNPNHQTDAAIEEVLAPTDKVEYSRTNPICANPVILVRNTGANALTSLDIEYWVNNASTKQTYTWTGNLASMDTTRITLPIAAIWLSGIQTSGNKFNVEIVKANSVTDDYSYNNRYSSDFVVPGVVPSHFSIEFKTNNLPTYNNYKIVDENGTVVGSSNFTDANTIYEDYYILNGCYKLIVEDLGGDGLSWWANTSQGVGYVRLKDNFAVVIKTFQPDFGGRFEYSFTTDGALSIEKNQLDAGINLYPNPAQNKFVLEGAELEGANVYITDLLGRNIFVPVSKTNSKLEFNTSSLKSGMYMVNIAKDNNKTTKKIIVNQ